MKTNLRLVFPGTCDRAFDFYAETFHSKRRMTMKFGDAPPGAPVPPDAPDLIMHTSMPLGGIVLMGCDAPKSHEQAMSGYQISVDMPEEDEVRRVFAALSDGGRVDMELGPTFWTPLFGMCTDKFGVGWMVSVPGPQPEDMK